MSLYIISVFYLLAGINHFWHKEFYIRIMLPWIHWHIELVTTSGVFEMLFTLLLIPDAVRRVAAWLIIVLLIAVFPVNIQMMLNYFHKSNPGFMDSALGR